MCGNHAERFAPYPAKCPSDRGSPDGTVTPNARESSRLSWCPTLARALDADYHVECVSGNGLMCTDGSCCAGIMGGSGDCMPTKQKQRLMCAHGEGSRTCAGVGGLEPLEALFEAPRLGRRQVAVVNEVARGHARRQPLAQI